MDTIERRASRRTGRLTVRNPSGGTAPANDWGVDSEYGVLRDVLLGPVESFRWVVSSSISAATARKGEVLDKDLALRQYREMVSAYESAGVTVHSLPVDEHLPMQVYARDSSFMTPYGAVVTQMAKPWRRGEYSSVLRFYLETGIPIYDMVSAGSFEGGDFDLIAPGCVLIGYCGERTQEVAAKQVGAWFEAEDWEVRYAPLDPFYVHIDLMVCMLAEKLAAVCLDTTDPEIVAWLRAKRIEIVPVSFRDTVNLGCNVVALGNDRVLSTAASQDLNARLRALGFEVYDPDASMFTKGGGGVHCLCQPLRRDRV
ncbi:MAG: arginine deiminase family protein [Rhodospirillales bacterium]|nr:arginine deiminase family protein [Rhodospirillales bacterium]MDH3917532.1 arginine deiminase family protein [Rhodospirillales bacterium]MDH3969132.1 arginine deiminase family protein [Rhodospirillales bacterium]